MNNVKEELSRLAEQHGRVTPEMVLDAARSPDSPLHKEFEWDDTAAAKQYRLEQARSLIVRFHVVYEHKDGRTTRIKMFSSLPSERADGSGYRLTSTLAANPATRDELLRSALHELEALKRRYIQLTEFVEMVDEMGERLGGMRSSPPAGRSETLHGSEMAV